MRLEGIGRTGRTLTWLSVFADSMPSAFAVSDQSFSSIIEVSFRGHPISAEAEHPRIAILPGRSL